MSLFGRRTTSETPLAGGDFIEPDTAERKKGRATPKRSQSEAARKRRAAPPRNSKEAKAVQRDRVREQRLRQREAMQKGDDRYLPARDKGPLKRYIRDYIDAHRTIGEFLIPVFIVLFVVVYIRTSYTQFLGSVAWVVILGALALDSVRVLYGVRKGITEKFGADKTKGIAMYALMRSWQMRKLRLPKPQVKHGAQI
ncbi:MAG: DUF3043 domain-containing protein [Sciscionella sp.]